MACEEDFVDFLRLSDLLSYKSKFEAAGVSKVTHLEDVDEEDLKDIGLSRIEIKRLVRKKDELFNTCVEVNSKKSNNSHTQPAASGSRTELQIGSVTFQRPVSQKPWQNKKFGWIPNATTPRSQFMNEVLPSFYQSMYRFCPNSRDFVRKFHAEGRRQYDLQTRIAKLEDRISNILNTANLAAAGKYLEQDYILVPSDMVVLENNSKVIKNLKENLEKEMKNTREKFSQYFSPKTGKLKDGHLCSKTFDEGKICELLKIQEKVNKIEKTLNEKQKQCSDMFKGNQSSRNKSRAKKENRRKAKKRKKLRASNNMEKVRTFISNTVTPMVINSHNLKLENLQTLSNNQVKYIRLLYNEGMLSEDAIQIIEDFIKTSITSNDETIMVSDEEHDECYSDSDTDSDTDCDNVDDDVHEN